MPHSLTRSCSSAVLKTCLVDTVVAQPSPPRKRTLQDTALSPGSSRPVSAHFRSSLRPHSSSNTLPRTVQTLDAAQPHHNTIPVHMASESQTPRHKTTLPDKSHHTPPQLPMPKGSHSSDSRTSPSSCHILLPVHPPLPCCNSSRPHKAPSAPSSPSRCSTSPPGNSCTGRCWPDSCGC